MCQFSPTDTSCSKKQKHSAHSQHSTPSVCKGIRIQFIQFQIVNICKIANQATKPSSEKKSLHCSHLSSQTARNAACTLQWSSSGWDQTDPQQKCLASLKDLFSVFVHLCNFTAFNISQFRDKQLHSGRLPFNLGALVSEMTSSRHSECNKDMARCG